jgi:hypothetical protein
VQQLKYAAKASANLGLNAHATFSGALLWHTVYPWPQRPAGLVEQGFKELGRRWLPILNAFDEAGVDLCYEIHPGEDLHDGVTFEMFLDEVKGHKRANLLYDPSHFVLQALDYKQYIDFGQVFKQLRSQSNRRGRHADAVGTNFGGAANLLGHRKRALEHLVQSRTQGTHLAGHPHSVFHLPQDLRLAQYHGVQTAGHSKGVARCLVVNHGVDMVVQAVGAYATRLSQPQQGLGHGDFLRGAINFSSVASGENGGFCLRAKTLTQTVKNRPYLLNGKRKPSPQIERSGGVVES